MTFGRLIFILKARWRLALCVLASVVVVSLCVSFWLPKRYTAVASVLLEVQSPDPLAASALSGTLSSGYIATQVEVMRSERVALQVLRELGLNDRPGLRQQWQRETAGRGNFDVWLAQELRRGLQVSPSPEANVIVVAYTAPDPTVSAVTANTFVRAYMEVAFELAGRGTGQSVARADVAQAPETAQPANSGGSLKRPGESHAANDGRLDVENARLAEMASELIALQSGAVAPSAGYVEPSNLGAELSRQEAKLHELNSRLGDRHPRVIELRASIAQLQAGVEAEAQRLSRGSGADSGASDLRLAQLRAVLEEQRVKVFRLQGERNRSAALPPQAADNTRRAQPIGQMTQVHLSQLQVASDPAFPSSPLVLHNTAFAAALGFVLAIGAAWLRERTDRRLRSEQDIVDELDLSLLGLKPQHRSRRAQRSDADVEDGEPASD